MTFYIEGVTTWILATLIVWLATRSYALFSLLARAAGRAPPRNRSGLPYGCPRPTCTPGMPRSDRSALAVGWGATTSSRKWLPGRVYANVLAERRRRS